MPPEESTTFESISNDLKRMKQRWSNRPNAYSEDGELEDLTDTLKYDTGDGNTVRLKYDPETQTFHIANLLSNQAAADWWGYLSTLEGVTPTSLQQMMYTDFGVDERRVRQLFDSSDPGYRPRFGSRTTGDEAKYVLEAWGATDATLASDAAPYETWGNGVSSEFLKLANGNFWNDPSMASYLQSIYPSLGFASAQDALDDLRKYDYGDEWDREDLKKWATSLAPKTELEDKDSRVLPEKDGSQTGSSPTTSRTSPTFDNSKYWDWDNDESTVGTYVTQEDYDRAIQNAFSGTAYENKYGDIINMFSQASNDELIDFILSDTTGALLAAYSSYYWDMYKDDYTDFSSFDSFIGSVEEDGLTDLLTQLISDSFDKRRPELDYEDYINRGDWSIFGGTGSTYNLEQLAKFISNLDHGLGYGYSAGLDSASDKADYEREAAAVYGQDPNAAYTRVLEALIGSGGWNNASTYSNDNPTVTGYDALTQMLLASDYINGYGIEENVPFVEGVTPFDRSQDLTNFTITASPWQQNITYRPTDQAYTEDDIITQMILAATQGDSAIFWVTPESLKETEV